MSEEELTIESYKRYLERNPNSKYKEIILKEIAKYEEKMAKEVRRVNGHE